MESAKAWSPVVMHAEAQVMGRFATACSVAEDWHDAIDEVASTIGTGGHHDVGFAFVHDVHVTIAQGMGPFLSELRERLGVRTLIGCACKGAIGQAVELAEDAGNPIEVEKGCVLSVGLLRSADATPFFLAGGADGDEELLQRKAADGDTRSILMVADPYAPTQDLLKRLDALFPKAVKAGGLTSALQVGGEERQAFMPSLAIAAEGCPVRLLNQGIAGVLLADVDVHTIACQGCSGVGPPVRVTGVQGPVCTGLGGRPSQEAVRFIYSAVDPATRDRMQRFLTMGLGNVGESEASVQDGDWLIRSISSVTPEGGLVVETGLEEGKPMRFHVRDKESAESDLALMLKRYRLERTTTLRGAELPGEPMGCFLFTCGSRGENLYGRRHVDARAAAEALGERGGARVAGFFAQGQIGSPGLAVPAGSSGPGGGEEDARPCARGVALHEGFTAVYAVLVPAARLADAAE